MRGRWLLIFVIAVACLGQTVAHRPGMSYTVEDPPQLQRLDVKRIRGKAIDRIGMAIPLVQLGLYTDAAPHKLVALAASEENGKFDFGTDIPAGEYRLIAKYPGLCSANIPLEVSRRGSGKKIELHMEYPGLGGCSYAILK